MDKRRMILVQHFKTNMFQVLIQTGGSNFNENSSTLSSV